MWVGLDSPQADLSGVRQPDKSVAFPCGEGEFFASGWELMAGLDLGLITDLKIKTVYEPQRTKDFARFVNFYYERKNQARESCRRARNCPP